MFAGFGVRLALSAGRRRAGPLGLEPLCTSPALVHDNKVVLNHSKIKYLDFPSNISEVENPATQ